MINNMMNSLFGGEAFYLMGMSELYNFEKQQEDWKERIKKEFRESCNLPRKKKKRVRKNLQLEWSIANWNPFKF
jgi:hypothetical protein